MLAMAVGLVAAAWMAAVQSCKARPVSWLLLFLLIVPVFLQLAGGELRNPWRAFEMAFYASSAWLVYRMAGARAVAMLGGRAWCGMLGIVGNISVLLALLQQFRLTLFSGTDMFPIWQFDPHAFAGILVQPNLQGLFLVLICVALWSRAITEDQSFPWWMTSVLPVAGTIATSSRGGLLVLLVGALFVSQISRMPVRALSKISAVALIGSFLSAYWHLYPDLIGQEVSLAERITTVGVQARLFIWHMCWQLLQTHPWLGIGAGNLLAYGIDGGIPTLAKHPEFSDVASVMTGFHYAAHNLPLQFLVEWGVSGGLFVVLLLGAVAKKMYGLLKQREGDLCKGTVQASIGLSIMLLHGMFSVSMMTGIFWVLLALYAAALFAEDGRESVGRTNLHKLRFLFFMLPAFIMLFNWQFFITREWRMEQAAAAPLSSSQFIHDVSAAIDNPWTSRTAIEWYLGRLVYEKDWKRMVLSENFAYRNWLMQQSGLSLRYLILIAHLKDDVYAERRWAALFEAAYPKHPVSALLRRHVQTGHAKGEAIDLGF